MINFNDLKPTVESAYSFVGLDKQEGVLTLHLPKGFTASTISTYEQKRDLFFSLYRIIRQFKSICVEKGYLDPDRLRMKAPDRDGVLRGEDGTTIATGTDEPLVFYSKLDWITSLLDAYDEYKIAALVYRLGRTEKVDYSQLHRFMHQGVFLTNGNIYIDTMTLPRPQVQFESTDIVAMYCYLLWEVSTQLGDEVSPEVKALSEQFRQHYLGIEASLFNEQDYEILLNELKDSLDKIDRYTPLKDDDYYTFYEAIERFLYGTWQKAEDGEIWGINNFHMVWESICLTYLAKTSDPESLLWLDKQFVPNSVLQQVENAPKLFALSTPFKCNGKSLRPDVVIFPFGITAMPTNTIYHLRSHQFDDYSYWVRFNVETEDCSFYTGLRICSTEQPFQQHTFDELKPFYTRQGARLLINRPLPAKFYSYWSIEHWMSDEDLAQQRHAMKYFNHIFYVCIQQGIWTFEDFKNWLAPLSGVSTSDIRPGGAFGSALFRDTSDRSTWKSIQKKFEAFLQKMLRFLIIDIKYQNACYFQEDTNLEDIKTRSVRKQFVYEHLLQEAVQKKTGVDSQVQIDSSFWVPRADSDSGTLLDGAPFLDGYLKLTEVNFNRLIDDYCKTA